MSACTGTVTDDQGSMPQRMKPVSDSPFWPSNVMFSHTYNAIAVVGMENRSEIIRFELDLGNTSERIMLLTPSGI